jgi:hypothetical protein
MMVLYSLDTFRAQVTASRIIIFKKKSNSQAIINVGATSSGYIPGKTRTGSQKARHAIPKPPNLHISGIRITDSPLKSQAPCWAQLNRGSQSEKKKP